jgi:hypothetical protein
MQAAGSALAGVLRIPKVRVYNINIHLDIRKYTMYIECVDQQTLPEIEALQQRLRDRLDEIQSQIDPLAVEAGRIRTQLGLVDKLLRVSRGEDAPPGESAMNEQPGNGRNIANIIARILADAASPLHISMIRQAYLREGNTIPGKGNESNLLAYVVRDPRFVRVAKGTYGLAGHGLIPQAAKRHRQRRKRKA